MKVRRLIEVADPGDIVLLGGEGLFQKAIRYGQKPVTGKPSLWSHAVLVYDSRLFLESSVRFYSIFRIDNGIQFTKFGHYAKATPAVLLKPPLLHQTFRDMILRKGVELEERGVTYPVSDLVGTLFVFWLSRGRAANPLDSRGLYCSAFVQDCYAEAGIDFTEEYDTNNTAPEHIWQYAKKQKWEVVWLS